MPTWFIIVALVLLVWAVVATLAAGYYRNQAREYRPKAKKYDALVKKVTPR